MVTAKFRTKASTQDRAIKEIQRGLPEGEIAVESVTPSKMSDQDVVVTISSQGEKWSGRAYHNIRGMADGRAIHLIGRL